MLPTGRLLEEGIAPMSGEIGLGGMKANGVNQRWISADVIERIDRCWNYAQHTSRSFEEPAPELFLERLGKSFESLKDNSPDDDSWDPLMIDLLRLKQWNPEWFAKGCQEHSEEIEALKKNILAKISFREMWMIELLEHPIEELRAAINNPEVREQVNKKYFTLMGGWGFCPWWEDSEGSTFLKKILNSEEDCFKKYFKFRYLDLGADIVGFRLFGEKEIERALELYKKPGDKLEFHEMYTLSLLKQFQKETGLPLTVENVLQKMVRDKLDARLAYNMKPFKKRYERLLKIFDPAPPKVQLGDRERRLISASYPILLASTKITPMQPVATTEYNFSQGRIGDEIDMMFVPEERMVEAADWLNIHHLQGRVELYPASLVTEMQQFPQATTSSVTIQHQGALDVKMHQKLNAQFSQYVAPYYRELYPNKESRFYHGVPHAVRVTFFSTVLRELYLAAGRQSVSSGTHLHLAAGLHDAARQNDGVDFWDKESAQMAQKVLDEMGCNDLESMVLVEAIADKDGKESLSLEKRIIHDSDTLEIMRCLRYPDDFRPEELWALGDLEPDTIYQLIREARHFIELTDRGLIKTFLETAEEPYKALIQILNETADRFPLLATIGMPARTAFHDTGRSLLPGQVLDIIQD